MHYILGFSIMLAVSYATFAIFPLWVAVPVVAILLGMLD